MAKTVSQVESGITDEVICCEHGLALHTLRLENQALGAGCKSGSTSKGVRRRESQIETDVCGLGFGDKILKDVIMNYPIARGVLDLYFLGLWIMSENKQRDRREVIMNRVDSMK